MSDEESRQFLVNFMNWIRDKKVRVTHDNIDDVARQYLNMPPRPRKQPKTGYHGPSDCWVASQLKGGTRI